jgi:hypothetical protein
MSASGTVQLCRGVSYVWFGGLKRAVEGRTGGGRS